MTALLSQCLVAFAMDYEKMSPVALSLSTSIICRIPPEGCPVRELGNKVGISALSRHGFLRLSGAKGTELATLTSKGLAVKAAYDHRIRSVEAEWRRKFGDDLVTRLRGILEEIAALIDMLG